MSTQVESGEIIFRQWNEGRGLKEQSENFSTLEELFALCLTKNTEHGDKFW
jgi:hypothetical protein